jgi:hypothetical protein
VVNPALQLGDRSGTTTLPFKPDDSYLEQPCQRGVPGFGEPPGRSMLSKGALKSERWIELSLESEVDAKGLTPSVFHLGAANYILPTAESGDPLITIGL